MSEAVLELRALRYGHQGRALGEPLTLSLQRGEVLALLGPNGCGKTTLLRTLLGLLPALGGELRVAGQALALQDRAALAAQLAYVPQAHAGAFAYRALDVVLMGRARQVALFALPSAADREAAMEALQRLGIADLAARPYTLLSGGERQLVLIARALAQQTPVLVMDEPTASLDFGNQRRVLREIEALKARGVAVLMSSHQPEHAARVADRVALLGDGRLQVLGPSREVLRAENLAALYGVDAAELRRSLPGLQSEPDDGERYREHMRRHRVLPKPAAAWDGRAKDYGRDMSDYVVAFLAALDLRGACSLLDVGSGPGALALPLASRLDQVVALDYSPAMLERLQQRAEAEGLRNIRCIHRAWEQDWRDVPVCDIAIASRSTLVDDLEAAVDKLNRHARLRVYLTVLVGGFIDAEIVALLGLPSQPLPDPHLLLGMLRQRGILPELRFIDTDSRLKGCTDFDHFAARVEWSTGPFDAAARERLRTWWAADPVRAARGGARMRWALVSWSVPAVSLRRFDPQGVPHEEDVPPGRADQPDAGRGLVHQRRAGRAGQSGDPQGCGRATGQADGRSDRTEAHDGQHARDGARADGPGIGAEPASDAGAAPACFRCAQPGDVRRDERGHG